MRPGTFSRQAMLLQFFIGSVPHSCIFLYSAVGLREVNRDHSLNEMVWRVFVARVGTLKPGRDAFITIYKTGATRGPQWQGECTSVSRNFAVFASISCLDTFVIVWNVPNATSVI
jgi:hypothetical protein